MDFMSRHIQEEHLHIKTPRNQDTNKTPRDANNKRRSSQSPDKASPKRARAAPTPPEKPYLFDDDRADPDDPDEAMPFFEAKKCPHCTFTAASESQVGSHF